MHMCLYNWNPCTWQSSTCHIILWVCNWNVYLHIATFADSKMLTSLYLFHTATHYFLLTWRELYLFCQMWNSRICYTTLKSRLWRTVRSCVTSRSKLCWISCHSSINFRNEIRLIEREEETGIRDEKERSHPKCYRNLRTIQSACC